ncbi:MAG: hypothetical protein ABJB49_05365 [Nitrospirota bacterium]
MAQKKPLDPLVKTALSLSLGLILITIIGMILTAPDRSIPPYSVMAQMGEKVTVSVPPNTTDAQIEALLFRFRAALESDRDGFGRLKIKPTTPNDPGGHYQRVTIYVLDNPGLAEESVLRDYLAEDPAAKGAFKRSVRGIYRLTPGIEIGVLGYAGEDTPLPGAAQDEANRPRILFQTHGTRPPQARQDAPLHEGGTN